MFSDHKLEINYLLRGNRKISKHLEIKQTSK